MNDSVIVTTSNCILGTIMEKWSHPWLQMAVIHIASALSLVLLPMMPSVPAALAVAMVIGFTVGFVCAGWSYTTFLEKDH